MNVIIPDRRQKLLKIKKAILQSRDGLIPFARYIRPDMTDPDNVDKSSYIVAPHIQLIADELEALERGDFHNLIISLPPRHGKSELASNTFIPWFLGRNPYWSAIMATYNSHFAGDFGRRIKQIIEDPRYQQVFPEVSLDPKSKSANRMNTTKGGQITLVGRGGTLTGRGGHLLAVDDPIKDRKEADSQTIRDMLWQWWTQVLSSRAMVDDVRRLLIQTRWHEDDLIGRITDPHNPYYSASEASRWRVVNLPALAMEDDPLGRKENEPLWPHRFSTTYLVNMREQDSRGFSALYQGEPAPESGLFFSPQDIVEYQKMDEIPATLRMFGASDHAISTEQWADDTVAGPFGVDEHGDVWIMPEVRMEKLDAQTQVLTILNMIKKRKPMFWFAERGHITKSIGPFLKKKMHEDKVWCSILELTPVADKQSRAQSIKGYMSAGRVHFPAFAPWYQKARRQILSFPAGSKDDFVDFLSMIGLGLQMQAAPRLGLPTSKEYAPGTFGHLKKQTRKADLRAALDKQLEGW